MAKFKAWTEDDLKGLKKVGDKMLIPTGITQKSASKLEYKGNKRVRNAQKWIVDDILFASKLEAMMYIALRNLKIPHERQYTVMLQPGFRYVDGKAIISIKWKVDFYLPWCNTLLETKGYATEVAKIKMKIFKYSKHVGLTNLDLIMVKYQKEIEPTVLILLEQWQKQ